MLFSPCLPNGIKLWLLFHRGSDLRPLLRLIMVVAGKVGVSPELICSRSRQRKPSEARAILSYLAVEETGYPAADVARFLGVKRMSVHEAVTRGKTLCAEYALLGQKRE